MSQHGEKVSSCQRFYITEQWNIDMFNKLSLCTLAICSALSTTAALAADSDYQLEQVLMVSRHNLRAPLADNGSLLTQVTRKTWPAWEVPDGQLTTKGGVLEVYMGRYTREWLAQQGLVDKAECPKSDDVFAYANSLQRTVATAQFFITGAFPGCDVQVNHQDEMGAMDPVFNPIITGTDKAFNQQALAAMTADSEKLALKPAYEQLEKMVNSRNSAFCNGKKQCDAFSREQNKFIADNGKEPGVTGPLKTGNALVDAFTLQYYEGLPLEQVAWGKIKTPEQWTELSAIKNGYHDTLFSDPAVARDVAAPLVDYIRNLLVNLDQENAPKVMLMVGHDSNISSLLNALAVNPYTLTNQFERTPIGGMVQFQRWMDKKNKRELVKVEYVYQSTQQLRDAQPLSLAHPPERVTLQMAGCPTDTNGFCPWDKFTQVLTDALKGTPIDVTPPVTAEKDADVGKLADDKSLNKEQTKDAAVKSAPTVKAAENTAKDAVKHATDDAAKTDNPGAVSKEKEKTGASGDAKMTPAETSLKSDNAAAAKPAEAAKSEAAAGNAEPEKTAQAPAQ